MNILIMTCSKLAKCLLCFFNCSKPGKWLVDLGLRYVCVSLRLVDLNTYSDVVYRFMISNFILVSD